MCILELGSYLDGMDGICFIDPASPVNPFLGLLRFLLPLSLSLSARAHQGPQFDDMVATIIAH